MQDRTCIVGKKYGRLTIVGFWGYDRWLKNKTFVCNCECGAIKVVSLSNLTNGSTKSCGCLKLLLLRLRNAT